MFGLALKGTVTPLTQCLFDQALKGITRISVPLIIYTLISHQMASLTPFFFLLSSQLKDLTPVSSCFMHARTRRSHHQWETVLSRQWLCCVLVLMLLLLCSPGQRVANEDPRRPAWPALSSPSGGDEVRLPDFFLFFFTQTLTLFSVLIICVFYDIFIAQVLISFSIWEERTSLLTESILGQISPVSWGVSLPAERYLVSISNVCALHVHILEQDILEQDARTPTFSLMTCIPIQSFTLE